MRDRLQVTCSAPLLLAAALVTACGRDHAAAAVQPPATHTIAIEGVSYAPQSLTVHVGDRIVWVNKDPFPHTATSQGAGVDSKEIAGNGGSWTYTAARAGDFNYICTLHPTMSGVVHVK